MMEFFLMYTELFVGIVFRLLLAITIACFFLLFVFKDE